MIREILLSVTLILLASQVQAQHEEVAEVDEMRVVFETTVCPEWKGFVKKQSFKVTPTFVTISTLAGVRNLEQGVPAEQVEKFEVVSIESEYFGVGFEVKYRTVDSQGRPDIETIHHNLVTKSIRMLGKEPLTISNCEEN